MTRFTTFSLPPTTTSTAAAATEPLVGPLPSINAYEWAERELARPEEPWYVHQLVGPRMLTVIAGRPKFGKSFLSLDMAILMSAGRSLGPIHVNGRIKTLYLDLEGARRHTAARIKTLCAGLGVPYTAESLQFLEWAEPRDFQLLQDGNAGKLYDKVKAEGIEVVFLDTLSRSFSGDEDKKKEIQKYLDELSAIRNDLGCAVVLVHHLSKAGYIAKEPVFMDPDATLRGSSALSGAYDVVVSVNEGFIRGERTRYAAVRGKYIADYWLPFDVGGEMVGGEFVSSTLEFGPREDEYVLVAGVPDSQRFGGGAKNSMGGKTLSPKGREEEYPR